MPDYNRMWEQYKQDVLNRVQNPGQTLATALREGMPTEQNPLGMFGAGGITKVHGLPEVFKGAREKALDWPLTEPKSMLPEGVKPSKDFTKIKLVNGTIMHKLDDGRFIDETGKLVFDDLKALIEHIKNPMPAVIGSNGPSSPFYKDPFKDTTR